MSSSLQPFNSYSLDQRMFARSRRLDTRSAETSNQRFRQIHTSTDQSQTQTDPELFNACFCSSTDSTAEKIATVVLYSATGALIGCIGGPKGMLIGAAVGCSIAVVKIVYEM